MTMIVPHTFRTISIFLALEDFGGVIWDRVAFSRAEILILVSKIRNMGSHVVPSPHLTCTVRRWRKLSWKYLNSRLRNDSVVPRGGEDCMVGGCWYLAGNALGVLCDSSMSYTGQMATR